MKIRLEIPRAQELPSQGRNSGSIPDGGATGFAAFDRWWRNQYLDRPSLEVGQHYRAWLDPDKTDAEFVFFVGWNSAGGMMVFEDGNGDLHLYSPDEMDIV